VFEEEELDGCFLVDFLIPAKVLFRSYKVMTSEEHLAAMEEEQWDDCTPESTCKS
jgi:hypothetical protein